MKTRARAPRRGPTRPARTGTTPDGPGGDASVVDAPADVASGMGDTGAIEAAAEAEGGDAESADAGGDALADAADARPGVDAAADASDGATNLCAGVIRMASDACHVAGVCNPSTGTCSNRWPATVRRATTATRAPRPTRASWGCAPARTRWCARPSTRAMRSGLVIPPAGGAPTRPPSTARRATMATPARRPTRARRGCAPASQPGRVHTARRVPRGRDVPFPDRPFSYPAAVNGTTCNDGNACTQTDTCQSGGVHGLEPGRVHTERPCHVAGACTPSTGCARTQRRGRDGVHERGRVHVRRDLFGRRLHGGRRAHRGSAD